MKAAIWCAVLSSVVASGVAQAQVEVDKAENAAVAESQAAAPATQPAPQAEAPAKETTKVDEPKAEAAEAQSATAVDEAAPAAVESPKNADAAPAKATEPGRGEPATAVAAMVGPSAPQAAFQSGWQDTSPDEKALFLEAFGESSKMLQERWDKATPDERRRILRAHPLIGARLLKHRWASATPEERAAFLEASPRTMQKVKEAWENATPEQRKMLALEHPYFARKAFHHGWMQATPQEKIAFVSALPTVQAELKARWTGATTWQKQWYARNYPGVESLATGKHWADISTEERAVFLEANPATAEKARESWQKMQPELRAAMVRKWQGWPLRAYHAQLENVGKTLVSARTHPAPATKPPAKATTKK